MKNKLKKTKNQNNSIKIFNKIQNKKNKILKNEKL